MADIGGPSQTREEEPRDIQTVWEQLVPREPSPLVTVEGREFAESDPEEESEEEEDPEELPPTADAELFDELYDRNVELQDRVMELEELADVRQTAIEQRDDKIQELTARVAELDEKIVQLEYQRAGLMVENEDANDSLREESAKRTRAEDAWLKVSNHADRLVDDVQRKRAKMEDMNEAFHAAIDMAQDRVLQYPVQFEDLPWYMMDRRTMVRIMEEERKKL